MKIYKIIDTPADRTYAGAGKAAIAIKNGIPSAIKYLTKFEFNINKLPAWCRAVRDAYCTIGYNYTRIDYISPYDLGNIKKVAIKAGHPAVGVRGGNIKASEIAQKARNIIRSEYKSQFTHYKANIYDSLSKFGDVYFGMCSCHEFIINND